LVNRGSKYYQENWENHLDLLEDDITGPLYKTLLERPGFENLTEMLVTGPCAISVSKVNQWVSVYVLFVWVLLIIYSAYNEISRLQISPHDILVIITLSIVGFITIISCFSMFIKGKTYTGKHNPKANKRVTKIE